ncbi:MAG: hypothetical protein OXN83_05520 [Oligoflexia bacterium]|nr:hypothetical protein [Oligoflexia bacterium]
MKLLLQIYYSFLFVIIYEIYDRTSWFVNLDFALELNYIFFAKPLGFFNLPAEIHSVIFLMVLFCCLLSIFKPWRALRVLTAFFTLVFFSVLYSYEKMDYLYHAFILSSVLVCFFNENEDLNSRPNLFTLRLIQGALLSHYFMSGLWKLRKMISSDFEFSMQEIAMGSVVDTLVERNIYPILKFLLDEPWPLSFGYFCVLIFQLTALTPVFLNRFFKLYGVLALLFHFWTGLIVIDYFEPTVLAVLFFLILAESVREHKLFHASPLSNKTN